MTTIDIGLLATELATDLDNLWEGHASLDDMRRRYTLALTDLTPSRDRLPAILNSWHSQLLSEWAWGANGIAMARLALETVGLLTACARHLAVVESFLP